MMNYIRQLTRFFARLSDDQRMTPFHVSLYMALFQFWNLNRFQNPFSISRDQTMQLSRIGSQNNYAKCMKQLQEWGYIRYVPASNLYKDSQVTCIVFDTGTYTGSDTGNYTGTYTGNDTGSDTGTDTGSYTGTDTGTDTPSLYINITNIEKQKGLKKISNGRRKNTFGSIKFDSATDKDYSEPL